MNMRPLGIVRKIDNLGRIVIPKEIRDVQGWKSGEKMEMFVSDNKLVIQSFYAEREKHEMIKGLEKVKTTVSDDSAQKEIDKVINYLQSN